MSDWSVRDLGLLARCVLEQASASRHRGVLVLSGEKAWCHEHAHKLVADIKSPGVVWVSDIDSQAAEVVAGNKVKTLLGQERNFVVFDAHAGFDPDAFGAVSGIINGGGLLLLLCPPLDDWRHTPDPAAERIAIWPYEAADVSGRFIKRLMSILTASRYVTIIRQHQPLPSRVPLAKASDVESENVKKAFAGELFRSQDQQTAVEVIEQMLHVHGEGHTRQPMVLVSDRGRGKSSALGIAAARLLMTADSPLRIVVTAPRPDAVDALFSQARRLLPDASYTSGCLEFNHSRIEFHAPDALCLDTVEVGLLLVDEAAAIPGGLLQQLLQKYSRIVFATTVHGYEGTGRGFAVRFRQTLDTQTPHWREVTMRTPIRWAENDPLEELVFRALLLDAEAANDNSVQSATPANVRIEKLDRDALVEDERLLSQLFGLLVVAHYRTTPNDLRNLLDGPGLSVYVMRFNDNVVATALLSAEGGFDPQLATEIFEGSRRPRGHLLAQSLLAHVGIREAAALKCARVMRIAVHPAVQRKGLGKVMLDYIREAVKEDGVDILGSSFGATPELLQFWAQAGMTPVRMGFHRDHASGEHSVMVLTSVTEAGAAIVKAARERFQQDLSFWLADPLRDLDAPLVAELREHAALVPASVSDQTNLSTHDRDVLHGFAHKLRPYEDSLGSLWRLYNAGFLVAQARLSPLEVRVVNAKLRERQSWPDVAASCELNGRAGVLSVLRHAVGIMLESVGD